MYLPYTLKYDYNSLEPLISRKTVEAHYHNHYLKYLKNLNEVLEKNNFKYQYPVIELFKNIDVFPIADRKTILYNAGGVVNHELYFDNMNINNNSYIPEPLNMALINKFGSIENFKKQFVNLASTFTGSGYIFLAVNKNGQVYLQDLVNQENPKSLDMEPILGIDLWEHAYYLDYGNNKNNYIDNYMKLIDFSKVNEKYKKILTNSMNY